MQIAKRTVQSDMSRIYGRILAVLCVLLVPSVLPGEAQAAYACTKYASAAGSDASNGSSDAPYRTVARLADALAPGQIGCLGGGTFAQSPTIDKPGITLTSVPGASATIAGRVTLADQAAGVTLAGLRVDGSAVAGNVVRVHSDDVTLLGNEIHGDASGASCVSVGPGGIDKTDRAARTRIEGNRIHDCDSWAIGLEYTDGAIVTDNYVSANPGRGIQLYPDAENSVVRNNVIDGNDWGIQLGGAADGEETVGSRIVDNVITRSFGYHVAAHYEDGATGRDNLVSGTCVDSLATIQPSSHYDVVGTVQTASYADANFTIKPGDACAGKGPLPLAASGDASSIARTSAVVAGEVNPHLQDAVFYVEYGTSAGLGSVSARLAAGSGGLPTTVNATLAGLSAGTTYFWRLVAENPSGGLSRGEIRTFTTLTPPETTIDSGPSGTTASGSPSFAFSSEASASFECKLDGPGAATGSYGSCSSPKSYAGLADGAYTFSVRASDSAGNADATPPTRSFTIDTSQPAVSPPPATTPPPTLPPDALAPPPPAPAEPVVDVTAPAATLAGSRLQRLLASVRVTVSCAREACRVKASGSVRVPRTGRARPRLFKLTNVTATLSKAGRATLKPRLSLVARTAIRRALRRGRRITVSLKITVSDAAGNTRTLARQVRLKL